MRYACLFAVMTCLGCGSSGASSPTADVHVAADAAQDVTPIDPCAADPALQDPVPPPLATPRWAFEPWISKDISDTDDTRAFVKGFVDRGIPVGVVVLDSPWETNYTTFLPNPKRYHDFDQLVSDLHAQQIRVVLWTTQMVNESSYDLEAGGDLYDDASPNFAEGKACGHFVNGAKVSTWWKGDGAAVDFFSAAARTWWNRQQIWILDRVDGFKLDFGEQYINQVPIETAAGPMSLQAYSERYYREMYAFGAARKGKDAFVTMVRPWDESYGFAGRFYARPEHAPVAWVGDNRRDWVGLRDALDEMFRSWQAGYTNVGSDIGGYLDRDDLDILGSKIPFDAKVFARWTAIGALGPFMQLHGRANLAPWTAPDHTAEITEAYTFWAQLHHQFVPMFFGWIRPDEASNHGGVVQPIGTPESWAGDYRYLLAGSWLVAPISDESGKRQVPLPAGRQWLDWWDLGAAPLPGGTTVTADVSDSLLRIPLYLDACTVVPFQEGTVVTGLAPAALEAHDGLLLTAVQPGCSLATTLAVAAAGKVTLMLSAPRPRPLLLAVRVANLPKTVSVDAKTLATSTWSDAKVAGWSSDAARKLVWIGVPAGKNAVQIVLE